LKGSNTTVYFATGNPSKFKEASLIASQYGIPLRRLIVPKKEIQSRDLGEIASFAASEAAKTNQRDVVAEDSGFFVNALMGFPGPYSAYVFETIGLDGILKLMKNARSRNASFRAAVAYSRPGRRTKVFAGRTDGKVASKPAGSQGFGYDPIFIPKSGDGRTFAQMTPSEKNSFSHRARAFQKFFRWYVRRR